MNRTDIIKAYRSNILSYVSNDITDQENFQNQVLRPILKFQNKLFVNLFLNDCRAHKINFTVLSIEDKQNYIENKLQKDVKLKALFLGTVIGLLTLEEFETYSAYQRHFNKRIIQMLIVRLKIEAI